GTAAKLRVLVLGLCPRVRLVLTLSCPSIDGRTNSMVILAGQPAIGRPREGYWPATVLQAFTCVWIEVRLGAGLLKRSPYICWISRTISLLDAAGSLLRASSHSSCNLGQSNLVRACFSDVDLQSFLRSSLANRILVHASSRPPKGS